MHSFPTFTPSLARASAILLAFAMLSGEASAQAPVTANVTVVLAKEEAGEVDASLRDVAALRQPPFNAFRSMSVLERNRIQLRPGQEQDIRLPNGRQLRVLLQRVMPDGRYRVRVSILREGTSDTYLPLLQVIASPGDPFFVAGQAHQGGTLVIGITLG